MSILIPTMRICLDAWGNKGFSNKWLSREISEKILDEFWNLSFIDRIKLSFELIFLYINGKKLNKKFLKNIRE